MESAQTFIKTLIENPIQIKSKFQAKELHAQIVKIFPTLTSTLLSVYSKLNLLHESLNLFNTLPSPPTLAWKSIIKCYSSNGCFFESLTCFVKMRGLGMYPDHNVFPSVLKSATHLRYLKFGESVHACAIRVGLEFDIFTENALLGMYSKLCARQVFDESSERMALDQNGSILVSNNGNNNLYQKAGQNFKKLCISIRINEVMMGEIKEGHMQMGSARKVFETMPKRDVVSWNTLILGYAQNGMYNEALLKIKEMGNANLRPDAYTLSSVLPVLAENMDILKGKEIHGYAIRHGFDRNGFIGSGLIDMYANCNVVEHSYRLFCLMPKRDGVLWCSVIASCVQNGLFDEGLRLFRQMLMADVKLVPISFSIIIPACAHLTTLPLGKQLHGHIIRCHFDDNIFIASALIHMYATCGNIIIARCIFDNMKQRDLVSWTSMIMGCAHHGHAYDAISLFEKMEIEGIKPNSVAFVAALTACGHGGKVNEGLKLFSTMVKRYKITPELEHYALMVDLLGRAGELEEAFRFICRMPKDKISCVCLPLLAACKVHKNVELAEKVAAKIFEIDRESLSACVLLSNTYSAVGRYKDAEELRKMVGKNVSRTTPACSWIEIGKKVHGFIAGDKSHPYYDGIISLLDTLLGHMEKKI